MIRPAIAEGPNKTIQADFSKPDASGKTNPNNCNLCHTDKSAEWALGKVKAWHPKLK